MCAIPRPASPRWRSSCTATWSSRIRKQNRELIINLTTGPGGRFIPSEDDPKVYAPGTSLLPPEKRVEHIALIKPDVCSLDLNTMNSGPRRGDQHAEERAPHGEGDPRGRREARAGDVRFRRHPPGAAT